MTTTFETGKPFLAAASKEELRRFMADAGEKAFRADQVYSWITRKWICDPDGMTNLSAGVKDLLREHYITNGCTPADTVEASDGSKKYLIDLHDGERIECASIPAEDGRLTFCLSSQVGCPVRCAFCVSGSNGLTRNLSAGEIIEEFLLLSRLNGRTPDNIVMMGIGEPLLNYDNLEKALDTICDPDGIGVAQRRITISTSGWTPGIRSLTKHGKQWNLAVSLHGPDDKTRALLIPDAFRRDIADILQACRQHREATGRLLTLEYVLLEGINDSPEQARRFARLAGDAKAKVNLIPYNKGQGAFTRPSREAVKRFENTLKTIHIPVTVRVEKGFDANAACGQLRAGASARRPGNGGKGKG